MRKVCRRVCTVLVCGEKLDDGTCGLRQASCAHSAFNWHRLGVIVMELVLCSCVVMAGFASLVAVRAPWGGAVCVGCMLSCVLIGALDDKAYGRRKSHG